MSTTTDQLTGDTVKVSRRSWLAAAGRFVLYAGASLIVLIFLANLIWKASGSNRWELEFERNGVEVYSLKSPGAFNKQYKAVMQADYSLDHLVAGLIENSTIEHCRNHIPDCIDMQLIKPWNPETMSDTVMWKLGLPDPFKPREIIMRSQVTQDPATKAVSIDVIAAPNAVERNDDAVRLTHVQNRWVYTPLDNGNVEIQFIQDMDMGGMFPSFLLNLAGAEEVYKFIHDQLPGLLDSDRLRSIDYTFVEGV